MSALESADAWTALLAHAMQLAQASGGWPEGDAGRRMRESVVPLVQLRAVCIGMSQLHGLDARHRAYARDQADVLVKRASQSLRQAWADEPMPEAMLDAMTEARQAVANALYAGLRCLRWPGPGSLLVPAWPESVAQVRGTLALMEPGSIALPGEVIGWWTEREDPACAGCVIEPLEAPVQVYRRFDALGRYQDSVTVPLHEALPSGMPMLVPLCVAGERIGGFLRDPAAWAGMQRAAGLPGA
jgi:hypothetical protein